MTPNEHAHNIRKLLRHLEIDHEQVGKDIARLHKALADAACECGAEIGLDEEIMTAAAAPKDPPPNDGGG